MLNNSGLCPGCFEYYVVSLSVLLTFSGMLIFVSVFLLVGSQLGYIQAASSMMLTMSIQFTKRMQGCFGAFLIMYRSEGEPRDGSNHTEN